MSAEGELQHEVNSNSGGEPNDSSVVHWTASEYISPDKGVGWYILLIVIALGLISIDLFIMRSWTFTALVVVMTISIIVYSNRPPRQIQYTLSGDQGLYIGEKLRNLHEFKSFGLINENGNYSIMLIPVKRFAAGVSVFFPQDAGEQIVDILGNRLPMEDIKLDFMDNLIRSLRI